MLDTGFGRKAEPLSYEEANTVQDRGHWSGETIERSNWEKDRTQGSHKGLFVPYM